MKVGDLVRLKWGWAFKPDSEFSFGIVISKEYFTHTVPVGHEGWYVLTILWENGKTTREPIGAVIPCEKKNDESG